MSSTSAGGGSDDDGPSWAAESLPMSVRKELLERELRKLGFRKSTSHAGAVQQQQQPQQRGTPSHPQADGEPGQHGD